VNRRLLLSYLGVTLFVLLALEVPLGVQNQRSERHDLESKVTRDAWVLSADAEDAVQSQSPAQLKGVATIAYNYSRQTGARVVIVDRQGTALIDTSRRVVGRESFASRPEIAVALKGNVAVGTRNSSTLHTGLLYVAVPIASGGVVHGAARITYPTSTVDSRIIRYWLMLAAIAAVVLAAAALIGLRLARFVTRPLSGVEEAAAAVGEGNLDARAPEDVGPPEVRSLAHVLNETVAKLAQLLRSQQEFVADASHELRTPLTALRLRLENLERDVRAPAQRDLSAALREVERLSRMVEGLLALARADAGTAPAGSVDTGALVRDRVDTWRTLAEERKVSLVADTDGAVTARTTPERLVQVLDNLVTNALEHSPPGGTVTVSVQSMPGGVELRVRDEGAGMSDEQRAHAFDRFWRVGSGHGGSGLGLAIVRKLVEADEGEVELAAVVGGGTDAIVRLHRG
jgi:signal transduction histidine kinase